MHNLQMQNENVRSLAFFRTTGAGELGEPILPFKTRNEFLALVGTKCQTPLVEWPVRVAGIDRRIGLYIARPLSRWGVQRADSLIYQAID